jgi:hypothetical protein
MNNNYAIKSSVMSYKSFHFKITHTYLLMCSSIMICFK